MKAKIFIIISYLLAITIGFMTFNYFNKHLNLLISTLLADIICTVIIFIISIIKNNSSVYDSYWSVIPPLIVLLWIKEFAVNNIYSYIILAVYLIWAIRLTLNWFINWKG